MLAAQRKGTAPLCSQSADHFLNLLLSVEVEGWRHRCNVHIRSRDLRQHMHTSVHLHITFGMINTD